jgi:hypothetical protein
MRLALFATLLTTAFVAAPLYADKPDKGDKKDREEQKDRKEHADRQADLSPWIQAWAKEGVKGRELTERLEKLMDQQRAGKLPPPPGAKREARDGDDGKEAKRHEEGEKKEREEGENRKGDDRQGPAFGRFGPPRGPGMRGFGGPGMRGGFGMRGFGGGEEGRPGMREFAQAHAQVQAQLQELKAQVARLHEELSRLERRVESDKAGKGPRDREARPEKPRKERRHDKDDDDDDHDKI